MFIDDKEIIYFFLLVYMLMNCSQVIMITQNRLRLIKYNFILRYYKAKMNLIHNILFDYNKDFF